MKKNCLILLFLYFPLICFSADYKIIKDCKIFDGNYNLKETLKKNTIVCLCDCSLNDQRNNNMLDFNYSVRIQIDGQKRLIDANALVPAETKKLFDDSLISYKQKENGKFLSSLTELEILKSNTRDSYYNIHKERIDACEKERGIYDVMEWYEGVTFNEYYLNNLFIIVGDSIKYDFYYFIKKIEKIKGDYIVSCELADLNIQQNSYRNETLEELQNQKDIKYKLVIDGDYINFFSENEKLLFTLVYIDKSVVEQYELLFREGKADLSKVTWPRHADGSCDYDGSKAATFSQKSSTITPNQTMSVTENLKLRSGEATTTKVLSVMAAGTKVKILEVGKSETIDGIKSNWVKVEVQKNARDRDGKAIMACTVGWFYGCYLR